MFVNPIYVVLEDGLYKLNVDAKEAIPDGLMPEAKLQDPQQLSTVLGRVLSVRAMLDRGVDVTILHVDPTEITSLKIKYKNLHLQAIGKQLYDQYKNLVCAATYRDEQSDEVTYTGIDASQINATAAHHDWGVKADQAVIDKIRYLDYQLIDCHLEPITSRSPSLQM